MIYKSYLQKHNYYNGVCSNCGYEKGETITPETTPPKAEETPKQETTPKEETPKQETTKKEETPSKEEPSYIDEMKNGKLYVVGANNHIYQRKYDKESSLGYTDYYVHDMLTNLPEDTLLIKKGNSYYDVNGNEIKKLTQNTTITQNKRDYIAQVGDKNDTVELIQQKLSELGYVSQLVTGYYGSITYDNVKAFQKEYGLTVNGCIDDETYAKLFVSAKTAEIINESKEYEVLLSDTEFAEQYYNDMLASLGETLPSTTVSNTKKGWLDYIRDVYKKTEENLKKAKDFNTGVLISAGEIIYDGLSTIADGVDVALHWIGAKGYTLVLE